jgi:hypothetical protein
MFDKNKLPPGLLKEVPSAKGNANKKKALQRRLAMKTNKETVDAKAK